eukprot:35181-Pyramimonas_sp.AAC.1
MVDARCQQGVDFEKQMEERNHTQMAMLFDWSQDLGIATLQGRKPRQAPVTVYSYGLLSTAGEFSFQAQVQEVTQGFAAVVPNFAPSQTFLEMIHENDMAEAEGFAPLTPVCTDGSLAIGGSCKIHDFLGYLPGTMAYAVNITNPPVGSVIKGGPVQPGEAVYLVVYSYTGVNPLPPEATLNPQVSNDTYFGFNTYRKFDRKFEPIYGAAFVELQVSRARVILEVFSLYTCCIRARRTRKRTCRARRIHSSYTARCTLPHSESPEARALGQCCPSRLS